MFFRRIQEKNKSVSRFLETFVEHQISIWFLKDFVTVKTGVMAAENSYLECNNISKYYYFNCILIK